MRCPLLRLWLGSSLLASLLTCGCQHARQSCPTCGGSRMAAAPVVSTPTTYSPTVVAPPSASVPVLTKIDESPVMHTTSKPETPADQSIPAIAGVESAAARSVLGSYREGPVARRTFTDITAHPKFAHDPNYHWMVGTLDYSRIQDSWVLRYASVEEDDRYGGSVTLVNTDRTKAFKNGQLVRVEGHLVNPDSNQLRPAYRVGNIQTVQP